MIIPQYYSKSFALLSKNTLSWDSIGMSNLDFQREKYLLSLAPLYP